MRLRIMSALQKELHADSRSATFLDGEQRQRRSQPALASPAARPGVEAFDGMNLLLGSVKVLCREFNHSPSVTAFYERTGSYSVSAFSGVGAGTRAADARTLVLRGQAVRGPAWARTVYAGLIALMSIASFLHASPFPPVGALPAVSADDVAGLRAAARGEPGQTVWPGLFPRPPVKLARLLLAARGEFDAATLREVAAGRYGGDRPRAAREARRYDAHDAFACALVHPDLDANARAALVAAVLPLKPGRRGWRSRRKSWAIVRWAAGAGYMDGVRLPPAIAASLPIQPPRARGVLPFVSTPCGPAAALDCFAARWPRFRALLMRERADGSWLDYVGIAAMGHRHFAAFEHGCQAPWVQGVFDAAEHVLAHGDEAAKNLVVVGLFEAVQGDAYRAGPAGDRYEARLGLSSLQAWADLIEGWTGTGIRDLAAWRRKGSPAS